MKIYITDQKNKLKEFLDSLKDQKVEIYDKTDLKEKITTIRINTTKTIEQLNLEFLFDYQIFPDNIMTFRTLWSTENRSMKIGDTIVQQAYLPPIKCFSLKLIFSVWINEIIDQPNRKGFSYSTHVEHVEKGISTFTIEQLENELIFKIHTFSVPGIRLTRFLGPIFSLPYQAFCTKTALKNVKRQLEKQ